MKLPKLSTRKNIIKICNSINNFTHNKNIVNMQYIQTICDDTDIIRISIEHNIKLSFHSTAFSRRSVATKKYLLECIEFGFLTSPINNLNNYNFSLLLKIPDRKGYVVLLYMNNEDLYNILTIKDVLLLFWKNHKRIFSICINDNKLYIDYFKHIIISEVKMNLLVCDALKLINDMERAVGDRCSTPRNSHPGGK